MPIANLTWQCVDLLTILMAQFLTTALFNRKHFVFLHLTYCVTIAILNYGSEVKMTEKMGSIHCSEGEQVFVSDMKEQPKIGVISEKRKMRLDL